VKLVYLFDAYELDEENLSLSREGRRLPLEPRALGVLLVLVRNSRQLLKKEAILEAVWKNTIVEESSLSRAVALLRKQLGDDARNPRFIETVPTLGYRFIAAVDTRARKDGPAVAGDRGTPDVEPTTAPDRPAIPPGPITPHGPATLAGRARMPSRYGWAAAAVALLLIAALVVQRLTLRHDALSLAKKPIVLAEFANSTAEPVFDGTLRQGMIVQLEQSPLLSLVSEQRIKAILRLMGQDTDARLTPALAREVCQRMAGAAVLEGSIARLGGQYVLGLRATNCSTGETLDAQQVQAAKKEEVLQALGQIASRFRTRVGESLASVSSLDTPLAEATTSSLEALKALGEANNVLNAKGSTASIPFFQRAIALDPEFALAHAALGRVYGDVGQETRSARSTAEAYKFRNRASERERFFIDAAYDIQVTGNLEKALETCETWERVYPQDSGSLGFRAGLILRVFGRYAQGAELARKLVATEPEFALAYHLQIINEIALGNLGAAQSVLDRAVARNHEIPYYQLDRLRLAFLNGNQPALERLMASMVGHPQTEEFAAGQEASLLAYSGRLGRSQEISERAATHALQLDRRELAARLEAGSALREALFGNQDAALRLAKAALDLSSGRDTEYGAAVAYALAHDSTAAKTLTDDLERRLPEDTAVRFHYAPTLRALLALDRGDPANALEALKIAEPFELGSPPSSFSGFYGTMYPVFVRGEAYLASRHGTEAAAEFQKILSHPTTVASDSIGALAHLELARAFVLSHDMTKAKAAYANFFQLWKNADSNIPALETARAEYARLH
jgi:DNA-binding winged helix-turn-helix (wHTH) protein